MNETIHNERRRLAEAIKHACVHAAQRAYVQAAAAGLCDEGAFEAAIGAIQMLDLDQLIKPEKQP